MDRKILHRIESLVKTIGQREMVPGIRSSLTWAAAATRSLPGGLRRSALPTGSIAGLLILQFSLYNSLSPSSLAPRSFTSLSSLRTRIWPPLNSLLSNSGPISGLRVSGMGSSSSFSSQSATVDTTPEDVLQFWFRDIDPQKDVYSSKVWFMGGPDFDAECVKNFGESLKLASAGALNGWGATARGRLALVIILDQFSRNIHRKSPLSYSQDQNAVNITRETIEQGWDKELKPWERHFLYMPLMHSESLADHDIGDRVFEELADEYANNEKLHGDLLNVLDFERKHSAVIKKFGRYPGRNAVLGRPNTKEEEEYLSTTKFPF